MDFSQFILYHQTMGKRIYLDNGATAFPKAPQVAAAMQQYLVEIGSNSGRGSYESAYQTEDMVGGCRSKLALFFGASNSRNVTFALNVTHALNQLIAGTLTEKDHVLISSMEHNAVVRALEVHKIPYTIVPSDPDGKILFDTIPNFINNHTKALILTGASNVTGTIQPIREAGTLAHRYGLLTYIDSAQSAPHVPSKLEEGVIDAIAFTGHKGLLGPQGTGGLVLSSAVSKSIQPILGGGTGSYSSSLQMPPTFPDRLEAGTQNLVGIAGLSAALDFLPYQGTDAYTCAGQLLTYLLSDSRIKVIGPKTMAERTAVISIDIPGKELSQISYLLESRFGIETRVGLHCAPLAHKSMHTFPNGTIRFSMGYTTTKEEIETTIEALKLILEE